MRSIILVVTFFCAGVHIYAQVIPEKKRARLYFKDARVREGWIQDQHWADLYSPSSIVFYSDSSQPTGVTYTTRELNGFEIMGMGRYTAMGVMEDCSRYDSITGHHVQDTSEIRFLPTLVRGTFSLLVYLHHGRADYYITNQECGITYFEMLPFLYDEKTKTFEGKIDLFGKLTQMVDRSAFTDIWKQYLRLRVVAHSTFTLNDIIKDFNFAYAESTKERKALDAAKVNHYRLSFSIATAQGYSKLKLPDNQPAVRGPISSAFMAMDFAARGSANGEVRLRGHLGYAYHLYNDFKFQSVDAGFSMLFSWRHRTRQFAYLGVTLHSYNSTWSPQTAKRIETQFSISSIERRWVATNWKAGVIMNESKWELGLEGNIAASLLFERMGSPNGFFLYIAKHFEWDLSKRKRQAGCP